MIVKEKEKHVFSMGDGEGGQVSCYQSGPDNDGMIVTKEFEDFVFEDIKNNSDLLEKPDTPIAVLYEQKGAVMGYEIHVVNKSVKSFFRDDKGQLDFAIQNNKPRYPSLSSSAQRKNIGNVIHLTAFNSLSRWLECSVSEL